MILVIVYFTPRIENEVVMASTKFAKQAHRGANCANRDNSLRFLARKILVFCNTNTYLTFNSRWSKKNVIPPHFRIGKLRFNVIMLIRNGKQKRGAESKTIGAENMKSLFVNYR